MYLGKPYTPYVKIENYEQGDLIYYSGSNWAKLAPGNSGYALTSNGTNVPPIWNSFTDNNSITDQLARDQLALMSMRTLINTAVNTGTVVDGYQFELNTNEFNLLSANASCLLILNGNITDTSSNNLIFSNTSVTFPATPLGLPFVEATSAYFTNATTYLTGPSNNSAYEFAGDFTIESWINVGNSNLLGNNQIWTQGDISLYYNYNSDSFRFFDPGGFKLGSSSLTLNQWYHVAIVRSGSTITFYLNGINSGSYTNSSNFSTGNLFLGTSPSTPGGFNGYISNFRITQSAIYTTNFAVPQMQLTPVINPSGATYVSGSPSYYYSNTAMTLINPVITTDAPPTFINVYFLWNPVITTYLTYSDPLYSYVTFEPVATSLNSVIDKSTNNLTINSYVASSTQSYVNSDSFIFNASNKLTVNSPGNATQFSSDFTVEEFFYPLSYISNGLYEATESYLFDSRNNNGSSTGFYMGMKPTGINVNTSQIFVSASFSVTNANSGNYYVNTAAITYTIPQSTTLSGGWGITIYPQGGTATIAINANDSLSFNGDSHTFAAKSVTIPIRTAITITTDNTGAIFVTYIPSFSIQNYPVYGFSYYINSSGQTFVRANNTTTYIAGSTATFTVPRSSTTLFNGWSVIVYAYGGAVTINTVVQDTVNSTVGLHTFNIPQGNIATISSDGVSNISIGYSAKTDLPNNWYQIVQGTVSLSIPHTTILGSNWINTINANNGAITCTPFGTDRINGQNIGVAYTIPAGMIGTIKSDGNGNLTINYSNSTFSSTNNTYIDNGSDTFTLPHSTLLGAGWINTIYALGGISTITPYSTDKINNATAGTSFTIPKGYVGYLTTDGAGNIYISFDNSKLQGIPFINNLICPATNCYTINAWHHIAAVRSGSTISVYVDGLYVACETLGTNFSDGLINFGGPIYNNDYFYGYMDGIIITKYAKYTTNFSPSATPLSITTNYSPTPVLGTDLTLEVSRDNGVTYTSTTLTNLASYNSTYSIIKGTATVSSNPIGNQLLFRLKTLNNLRQNIAAPAIYCDALVQTS